MAYTETAFLVGALTGASIMWMVNHTRVFFREIKDGYYSSDEFDSDSEFDSDDESELLFKKLIKTVSRQSKSLKYLCAFVKSVNSNTVDAVDVVNKGEDEVDTLFNEEFARRNTDSNQNLDVLAAGLKKTTERCFTKSGGGYMTNSELDAEIYLTEEEEKGIMGIFSQIKGLRYADAKRFVEQKKYKLWPVYVNGVNYKRTTYRSNVIGVAVTDPSFVKDPCTPTGINLSPSARIVQILEVGGTDRFDRFIKD